MNGFLRAVQAEDMDRVASYFPRRGSWLWQRVERGAPPGRAPLERRFAAADTRRELGPGGALCHAFHRGSPERGAVETWLVMQVMINPRDWRREQGDRFVPRDTSLSAAAFVRWRVEDGRWVIAALGDETIYPGHALAGAQAGSRPHRSEQDLPWPGC
jgi:hypothetical protein